MEYSGKVDKSAGNRIEILCLTSQLRPDVDTASMRPFTWNRSIVAVNFP